MPRQQADLPKRFVDTAQADRTAPIRSCRHETFPFRTARSSNNPQAVADCCWIKNASPQFRTKHLPYALPSWSATFQTALPLRQPNKPTESVCMVQSISQYPGIVLRKTVKSASASQYIKNSDWSADGTASSRLASPGNKLHIVGMDSL